MAEQPRYSWPPTLGLKCGRDCVEYTQSETVETKFQSERGLGPRMKIPEFPKPERRWVLLKRPRCDTDGVGEGKWP